MMTFDDYSLRIVTNHDFSSDRYRLGVVVFTRPEDKLCKEVIGPSLNYLHEHTGKKVHFYFVGFCDQELGAYSEKALGNLFGDKKDWYFSPSHFSNVQENFEKMTNDSWQYSGGTDLLIVPYLKRDGVFNIDARKAIDIKLSRLAENTKNYIPEEIVQIIVRQLKKGKDIDGVSNSRIMDGIKTGLKSSLLGLLPGGVSNTYSVLEPFAVRDLT